MMDENCEKHDGPMSDLQKQSSLNGSSYEMDSSRSPNKNNK